MEVIINGEKYVPAPVICEDASPLETRMFVADLDREMSLREYLHELMITLWTEGEGFSGKRPFGNSGWQIDICQFLVKSGTIYGKYDEDGYLENYDEEAAFRIMPGLIAAAFSLSVAK